MVILIIFALLGLAVLYGIFFLIFKLIWLLFKNKRNLWPLILAGVFTVLFTVIPAILAVNAFHRFTEPLTPIIEAVQEESPSYGVRFYMDQQYPFTMSLYNGMVMSEWITWNDVQILLGLDTNLLTVKEDYTDAHGVIVFRQTKNIPQGSADDILEEFIDQAEQNQDTAQVSFQAVTPVRIMGPDVSAAMVNGDIRTQQGAVVYFSFLLAKTDQAAYYVLGLDQTENGLGEKTVQSFRLSNQAMFEAPSLPMAN